MFAAIASHIRSCIAGFVRLAGGRVWTHDKSEMRAARMRVEDDGNDVRSLLIQLHLVGQPALLFTPAIPRQPAFCLVIRLRWTFSL